jgi:hypothetical protein
MSGMTKVECRMPKEFQMTDDELLRPKPVIPSEVDESRGEIFRTIPRDPSTPNAFGAQDDSDFGIRASSFLRHSSFVIRHYV